MKVLTKNNEELKVKRIYAENDNRIQSILYPEDIKKIIYEDENSDLKHYEIKRIGHLSLCYKTFINRKATDTELDICAWNADFTTRWTVADFEPDYDGHDFAGYKIESCGERLNTSDINWQNFGELVNYGYDWISKHTQNEDD